jgi:hypothetical protein
VGDATASRKDADGRNTRLPASRLLFLLFYWPDLIVMAAGIHRRHRSTESSSDFFARRAGKTRARMRRENAAACVIVCVIVKSESENSKFNEDKGHAATAQETNRRRYLS